MPLFIKRKPTINKNLIGSKNPQLCMKDVIDTSKTNQNLISLSSYQQMVNERQGYHVEQFHTFRQ